MKLFKNKKGDQWWDTVKIIRVLIALVVIAGIIYLVIKAMKGNFGDIFKKW